MTQRSLLNLVHCGVLTEREAVQMAVTYEETERELQDRGRVSVEPEIDSSDQDAAVQRVIEDNL